MSEQNLSTESVEDLVIVDEMDEDFVSLPEDDDGSAFTSLDNWDDVDLEDAESGDGLDFSDLDGEDTSGELAVVESDSAELNIPELTVEQAQELTEHIRSTSDVLYVLVARAHAGKAHKALGYSDFGAYVKAEFDISRSRAYQFINQANVIQAIEESTPEGTQFKLSEAAARDLKNYVEELAPEIRDATRDLDPNEAGAVVEEMVADYRDKINQEKNDFDDDDFDLNFDDIDYDAPDFDGEGGGGGGSQFDDMENFDNLDDFELDDDKSNDIDIEEASVFRKKLEDVYAFYTALNSLGEMPDVQEIIGSVQESRRSHLNTSLPKAKAWLDAMYEAWFSGDNALVNDETGIDNQENTNDNQEPELGDEPSEDDEFDFEHSDDEAVSDYTESSDFGEKSDIN